MHDCVIAVESDKYIFFFKNQNSLKVKKIYSILLFYIKGVQ